MPVTIALCVIDESKSKPYKTLKTNFQKQGIDIYEATKAQRTPGDTYSEKLDNLLRSCHAIVVVCTESMKKYLNNESASICNILTDAERNVLNKGFDTYYEKVIKVSLSANARERDVVPNTVMDVKRYRQLYHSTDIDELFAEVMKLSSSI